MTQSSEPDNATTPPLPTQAAAPTAAASPGRRRLRPVLMGAALAAAAGLAALLASDLAVTVSARNAVADDIAMVEPMPVALLLGTARTHQGRPNQFYRARIEAAAALFHSGKVRGILVSGDNSTRYYNEPIAMRKDLIALGVPAEFITLDYAGFRTLDSMIRAKKVFGLDHFIVVSQRFHAERAVFLARHHGIDARGLAAEDPDPSWVMRVRAREVLARVAAMLDLATGRGPKFLGDPETVRLREPDEGSSV
jgi:SanA protein